MPLKKGHVSGFTSLILSVLFVAAVLVIVAANDPAAPTLAALPQVTAPGNGYLPVILRPAATATPTRTATPIPGNPTATLPAHSDAIIVDHNSVALFDQIPPNFLAGARALTMLFVDRSVGGNINDGLNCLASLHSSAPNHCVRHSHPVSQFSVDPAEVSWSQNFPRENWEFRFWPGPIGPGTPGPPATELNCGVVADYWYQKLDCFIHYVDANPTLYQVYSYQNSYLEVSAGSDIASATTGYFAPQPNRVDITDFEALEARHPTRVFIHWTSSLARNTGAAESTSFNHQMRQYALLNDKILFDVADIESHDPSGAPCYDNRDGVAYQVPLATSGPFENHPDDGQAYPAICQHYTSEAEGGHLGNPSAGKIRIAKAFWVLMARIAGWNP